MASPVANPRHLTGAPLPDTRRSSPLASRTLLVAGGVAAIGLAAFLAAAEAPTARDPDLARLLRGMAMIKAVLTLAALGAVLWRLGHPISPGIRAVYLVGTWALAASTVLIAQLVLLPAAALALHAGEIAMLLAAWRDDLVVGRRPGAPRR